MSAIRSKGNRSTELAMAALLRRNGINGWRRGFPLSGRPDFVFPSTRVAVFVDGCFWHGCYECTGVPRHNRTYWQQKIARNRARDRRVSRSLREAGWSVCRVWEHCFSRSDAVAARIRRMLEASSRRLQQLRNARPIKD